MQDLQSISRFRLSFLFIQEAVNGYEEEYRQREIQYENCEAIGARAIRFDCVYKVVEQKFKQNLSLETFLATAKTFGSVLLWKVDSQMGDPLLKRRWIELGGNESAKSDFLITEIMDEFQKLLSFLE